MNKLEVLVVAILDGSKVLKYNNLMKVAREVYRLASECEFDEGLAEELHEFLRERDNALYERRHSRRIRNIEPDDLTEAYHRSAAFLYRGIR